MPPTPTQNGVAYSYIRCSTPSQIKGDTKPRQLDLAVEYAEEHHLTLCNDGYEDLGLSGFHGKNTEEGSELRALLDAIKAGRIRKGSTLIIENLDRLSRDFVTNSLSIFLDILHAGIFIATAMDNKLYSRESVRANVQELMYSITILSRGHEESMAKSTRITRAWKRAHANAATTKIKQHYPSWLQLKDNQFTVIKDKAAVIQSIYSQYLSGTGTNGIARDLNTRGIRTFMGRTWNQTTVKFFLKFPAVMGEYYPARRENGKKVKTGQVVKDYYPVIIPEADFLRVQAKLKLNPTRMGRPQKREANLFHGIMKCGYCGGSMGIYNASKSSSFICWNGVAGGCLRVAYPADEFELRILGNLVAVVKDWVTSKADTAHIEELDGMIALLDGKISNLVKVIEGGADVSQVIDRLKELKTEKETLEGELQKERSLHEAATSNGASLFQNWSIESYQNGNSADRLALIPHIRRHIKQITVYSVGDQYKAYAKRLGDYVKKGHKGSTCYHAIRKEFNVERLRYFTVQLHYPVKVDGKLTDTITPFKIPNLLVPDGGGFKTINAFTVQPTAAQSQPSPVPEKSKRAPGSDRK